MSVDSIADTLSSSLELQKQESLKPAHVIEKHRVLKDAFPIAQYGSEGASGVVIIKTK
jgi:TonB-dependent SusC/RagA subfamily outer membrane receptor